MQYIAWAFFLALVIIGVFVFAPKPEDAKKTEEEAPEIASQKHTPQKHEEEAKDKGDDLSATPQ